MQAAREQADKEQAARLRHEDVSWGLVRVAAFHLGGLIELLQPAAVELAGTHCPTSGTWGCSVIVCCVCVGFPCRLLRG